jgi:hypothetical protein
MDGETFEEVQGEITCWLPNAAGGFMILGENLVQISQQACSSSGGAIWGEIPAQLGLQAYTMDRSGSSAEASETAASQQSSCDGESYQESPTYDPQLQDDVMNSGVVPGHGGNDYVGWDPDAPSSHYDCDDFARDLEEALEGAGYDATFTLVFTDGDGDGNVFGGANDKGHAITDVHWPDGTTTWVEPQNGKQIIMSTDGDDVVDTGPKPESCPDTAPTEGNEFVVVFDNRTQAACEYGWVMDRGADSECQPMQK